MKPLNSISAMASKIGAKKFLLKKKRIRINPQALNHVDDGF